MHACWLAGILLCCVTQLRLVAFSWWRHQMETFSALLAICVGNSSVPGEFPTQKPVTRSFHVFFHLCLNKPLSKQSWGWWLETLLWCHCNVLEVHHLHQDIRGPSGVTHIVSNNWFLLLNFWCYLLLNHIKWEVAKWWYKYCIEFSCYKFIVDSSMQ